MGDLLLPESYFQEASRQIEAASDCFKAARAEESGCIDIAHNKDHQGCRAEKLSINSLNGKENNSA